MTRTAEQRDEDVLRLLADATASADRGTRSSLVGDARACFNVETTQPPTRKDVP